MIRDLLDRLRSGPALRLLIGLAVVGMLTGIFLKLGGEIAEGDTQTVDEWVLVHLRTADLSDPIGPTWFEEMARDATALGGNLVTGLALLVAASYLSMRGRWRSAAFLVVAVSLGILLMYMLKLGYDRPRPDLVPARQRVYTSSFPSGHAMGSALTYLTLAVLVARVEKRRKVQVFVVGVALCITGMVGFSRVYLGVHYPTDVIGGWGLGAAWAVLAWLAYDGLAKWSWVEP